MKRLRRDAVLAFFANLTPCVVGVEACAESHFGQEIARLGHRCGQATSLACPI
jgi:transposase